MDSSLVCDHLRKGWGGGGMYIYVPCLNFQNRYFPYHKVGYVLVNIEPIFMLFVTISSCLISLFQGHVLLIEILP